MKIIKFSLLALMLLPPSVVQAREIIDMTIEIPTSKTGADAKQEAFDQATEEATKRLTEELLGPEKTAHSWDQLRAKLLKNSTRYVLFIKGSQPQNQLLPPGEAAKVTVQMRLSPDALEQLLREYGLFAGGSVRLLPLFTVREGRGSKAVWWTEWVDGSGPQALATDYLKRLITQLNTQFKGQSIYVLDPTNASFRLSVPSAYRSEGLRREDQALLAQYLKADVLLTGQIQVRRPGETGAANEVRIDYDLQLWQARSLRMLAEVTRSEVAASDNAKVITAVMEPVNKKIFAELAAKLGEAVAAGNLNLNTLQLAVIGNLGFRQQVELRRRLGELREVRVLRERRFEPARVTYEVETPFSAADVAKAIQRGKFSGYSVSVSGVQDNGLVLDVRATSAQ